MFSSPRLSLSLAAVIAVVALGPFLSACGSSSKSGASEAPAGGVSVPADTIVIKDFKFNVPASVKVGATVTVMNQDMTAHTVTANDRSFDTGPIQPGTSKSITVGKAGEVPFHCDIHDYMTGALKVS